jgi:hypothetical protein
MAKQFYTEKDIEDLVQRGVKSLQVNDDIVLTELAYEKARRLGLQLITELPDSSPAAPVRPYLSENKPVQARPQMDSVSQAVSQPAITPAAGEARPGESQDGRIRAVEQRIRSAVIAKLGDQVDAKLLDDIIHRVVRSTGLK